MKIHHWGCSQGRFHFNRMGTHATLLKKSAKKSHKAYHSSRASMGFLPTVSFHSKSLYILNATSIFSAFPSESSGVDGAMGFIHPRKRCTIRPGQTLSIWCEGLLKRPSQRKQVSESHKIDCSRLKVSRKDLDGFESFQRFGDILQFANDSSTKYLFPILLWKACRAHRSAHLGNKKQC